MFYQDITTLCVFYLWVSRNMGPW